MPDWGAGKYEVTAADIEPVAQRVVAMAQPLRHESVLDIACGTGNAALLAARFRAKVTGVDQAPRLVEVARQRAEDEGLDATFLVGDAESLDFPDESFDVALSIFGIIFAADANRAFAELVRVLKPGGRAYITAWQPVGAIDAMVGVFVRAVNAATNANHPTRPVWQDAEAVREMASGSGVNLKFHDGSLGFRDSSPEAFFEKNQTHHPMSVMLRPVLESAGTLESVGAEALQILKDQNEDPAAFLVTSRYQVLELRK